MHFCPVAFGTQDTPLPHHREMLADFSLPLAGLFNQLLDGSWTFAQQGEQFETRRIGQDVAQFRLELIQASFEFSLHSFPLFLINMQIFDYMNIIAFPLERCQGEMALTPWAAHAFSRLKYRLSH